MDEFADSYSIDSRAQAAWLGILKAGECESRKGLGMSNLDLTELLRDLLLAEAPHGYTGCLYALRRKAGHF